tara:strand:- start:1358 stop:2587 length:1230 start_codon:yes stop_codon:yes gene_type:complete
MNQAAMDAMFKQMNMARSKKKSPKRNNRVDPEVCIKCKEVGMIVEDEFRVCMNCGAVNPGYLEEEQGIKNNNPNGNGFRMAERVAIVRNKSNKFHIRMYVHNLYKHINPLKESNENVLTEIQKNVIQLGKKKKKGLQGMDMYVIVGIFMECALIKNNVPIIRPQLLEYIMMANNADPKRKTKTLEYVQKKYNKYRGMKEISSIINDCINHKPTVRELMKFLMNKHNLSVEARNKVSKLVTLLSPKNNNNNRPNIIARKSNNELAAFILLVVASHQNTLPPNVDKNKTVYGVSVGVFTNMYKGLLQMKAPFALKPVNELFKSKMPTPNKQSPIQQKAKSPNKKVSPQKLNNIKDFIIQIGDKKRKCTTYPKPEIRNEAIARGISKDIVNDKSHTKESLCALLKKHQLAGV